MQWGIRNYQSLSLASTLSDGLIEKMESDPCSTYSIVIDSIRIIIDYGVVPGGPISLSARITNPETNDEVTSGIKIAESQKDIQLILEKFLGMAYLLRK